MTVCTQIVSIIVLDIVLKIASCIQLITIAIDITTILLIQLSLFIIKRHKVKNNQ